MAALQPGSAAGIRDAPTNPLVFVSVQERSWVSLSCGWFVLVAAIWILPDADESVIKVTFIDPVIRVLGRPDGPPSLPVPGHHL